MHHLGSVISLIFAFQFFGTILSASFVCSRLLTTQPCHLQTMRKICIIWIYLGAEIWQTTHWVWLWITAWRWGYSDFLDVLRYIYLLSIYVWTNSSLICIFVVVVPILHWYDHHLPGYLWRNVSTFLQVTDAFLNGHSNLQIQIIGLKMSPVLQHVKVPDPHQGALNYSSVSSD